MHDTYILAFINLALCAGIVVIAFCRLHNMNGTVLKRVQSEYAAYLGGALVCGLQPLLGEWPGWGTVSLAGAVLIGLACSAYVWQFGVPFTATKQHLDDDEVTT